ncbi:MAG: FHIPEP family type III secretion protein [Candidatus Sericytochromatia bacterium]
MAPSLLAPLQSLFRFLDEHPAIRLLAAAGLLATALLAPLPGWVLDAWIVLALASAAGMAVMLTWVGQELSPEEALSGLPSYLHRFAFHRMALAIALTRAVLLERDTGAILDWVAHQAFARNVGVGLAAVAVIYLARVGLAHYHRADRLRLMHERLPEEAARLDKAEAEGRLSPVEAGRRRRALEAEVRTLAEAGSLFRLLRHQALVGLTLAVCFLAAGLAHGLVAKGLPLSAVLLNFTAYGLAEATITALPGLIIGLALSHWLVAAREDEEGDEAFPAEADRPLVSVEAGREAAFALKRAFPAVVAMLRARLMHDLGLALPRVGLTTSASLPPTSYRILVRGQVAGLGEISRDEPAESLAGELERAIAGDAAALLPIETTQAMLDDMAQRHPVLVAEVRERLGLPTLHGVLKGLLREQAPLRDMPALLEALVVTAPTGAPVGQLVEEARRAIAPAILAPLADGEGRLLAFELDPAWLEPLAATQAWDALDPALGAELARALTEARLRSRQRGPRAVLVAPRRYRRLVAELLREHDCTAAVVAPEELTSRYPVRIIGVIKRPAPLTVS